MSSLLIKYIVCIGLALALLFPSTMPAPAAAQEPAQIPIGSKMQVTVEQEYTFKPFNGEGGGRLFYSVKGEVEVVVPENDSIFLFEESDLVLRGLGHGTFEAERDPDYRCEGGSVSGTYNAWIRGGISKGREDFGENKDEINGIIQAFPAPPGLGDASLVRDTEDLGEPETSKGYEKIEPITCKDRINPERTSQEGVVGRPNMIGQAFTVKPRDDGVIEFEDVYSGPSDGSRIKITISPPGMKYKIHGTVKDSLGNPMSASKLAFVDFEDISDDGKIKKLSQLKPDFEDSTTASDDGKAEYKFELERPVSALLPEVLVASVLWYDGKGEFAVTNGNEVDGRYVPVYQALCISNEPDKNCELWKKTEDGFEAEVNFVYGGKALVTESFMEHEGWVPGPGNIDSLMAEAALVYSNSYKAMKYFEGIMGPAGVALNPLMIQVRAQVPGCTSAQYDGQAKLDNNYPSFGDLGSGLEKVESTGSSIRICDHRSATTWKDIPVGREWHELGHYLNFEMYLNFDRRPFENHAGYSNESTNDSLAEGFAEFVAMLINEHYGAAAPNIYPTRDGAGINLEEDYKVWGESVFPEVQPENETLKIITIPLASYHEEWAIAGILWDLHDPGNEVNAKHVIGQDGNGQNIWASTSKIYPDSTDAVSLSGEQILQTIKESEPKTLFALYDAFKNTVSSQQLDMIFVNHGAFADIVDRNLIQDLSGEQAGPTGHTPERLVRGNAPPALPGSYLSTNNDAKLKVNLVHEEPFSNYDFSYLLNMSANEPAYFEMPPSYYPSMALVDQVSRDGKTITSNVTAIDSHQYWDYIRKNPTPYGIFSTIQVSSVQPNSGPDVTPQAPSQPSGCLIATAAFGSELTPQVQFLRGFRDNHILATASGSSFMTVFNAWYYSFSPQVADYERQEPWLQQTVRIAIYPLLGILQTAEKAYTIIPGEYGSIIAGLVTSSLIGAVYFTPIALSIKQVRNNRLDYKLAIAIITAISISIVVALIANNMPTLMVSTSLLVLATLSLAAIYSAKAIWRIFRLCKN